MELEETNKENYQYLTEAIICLNDALNIYEVKHDIGELN